MYRRLSAADDTSVLGYVVSAYSGCTAGHGSPADGVPGSSMPLLWPSAAVAANATPVEQQQP